MRGCFEILDPELVLETIIEGVAEAAISVKQLTLNLSGQRQVQTIVSSTAIPASQIIGKENYAICAHLFDR